METVETQDSGPLLFLPSEPEDEGTQRCRLGPKFMDQKGLKLGSLLNVILENKRFLCCAWPRKDGWDGGIQLDPIVYLQNVTRTSQDSFHCKAVPCSNIVPLATSVVESLSVTVVITNYNNVQKWKRALGKRTTRCEQVKTILRGICVGTGFTVVCENLKLGKLFGVSHIMINNLTCNEVPYGVVTMNSDVELCAVLSKDKYEQQMNQTNESVKLGGLDKPMEMLKELVNLPFQYPKALRRLGLPCPRGILLRGPPGCGKTSLVKVVSQDLGACLLHVCGSEVFGALPGEGEETLQKLFHKALQLSFEGPCILFIDEVDALCPKKGKGQGGQERRLVAQLGALMDSLSDSESVVIVVGATNRPNAIDPSLRRAGRFEKEIFLGIPTVIQREQILKSLTCGLTLSDDVCLSGLSEATPGFVGADLASLVQQATYAAIKTQTTMGKVHEDQGLIVSADNFKCTLASITPSTQRGSDVLVDHRPVLWTDVGGLDPVKMQLKQAVEWPMKHPDAFSRLGIPRPKGLLLYGPPGCAKTLLVRAAATACNATFLSISGGQLYSPFVGDSERKIAEVFQQARAGAPSILFLDELDAVIGKRSHGKQAQGVQDRVLSTLLNEMDGIGLRVADAQHTTVEPTKLKEGQCHGQIQQDNTQEVVDNVGVLVVAATNRPDLLDEAILRPGRLDRMIFVPPPDLQARLEILQVHTRNMPLDNVNLESIAEKTENFTGADLENICREAALHALSVDGLHAKYVTESHFSAVLANLKPTLSSRQLGFYTSLGHAKNGKAFDLNPKTFNFSEMTNNKS